MTSEYIVKDCCVIGAGISGLAMARWLKKYNIDYAQFEKSSEIGGLWRYRESDYGVMAFTHINVSKHNYCYSDHSFPKDTTDYPHHSEMYNYIKSYADKNSLFDSISFNTEVVRIEEATGDEKLLITKKSSSGKAWKVVVRDVNKNETKVYLTPYVSICSGHHATPIYADFIGLDKFEGQVIHSIKYKSASFNNMSNKRVLVVGIGNSAVDVAVNLVQEGRCPKVCISTRSGAWVVPNYVNGFPTDLYACRAFLYFPWRVASHIFENVVKFIYGDPKKYNLNPRMKILQTQPTVSPTLIHHIQRKDIVIAPNIKSISGSVVTFENGSSDTFDCIILCTGYKIDLNYLDVKLKREIFQDKEESILNLYKNVFNPSVGKSLAFIGFAQPTSGGLLSMSEMQARWHIQLMTDKIQLPNKPEMIEEITKDQMKNSKRFHASKRHTIQQDPIIYNDEIGRFFNATPDFKKNFLLFWRLLFSTCGPAQYRLNGPDAMPEASETVKSVPVTNLMKLIGFLFLLALLFLLLQIVHHPYIFAFMAASFFLYKRLYSK